MYKRQAKGSAREIMREGLLAEVYQTDLMIRYVPDARRHVCMTARFF